MTMSQISPRELAFAACREHFGNPDVVARGPGRINLIGEHTDYNDGFVLPAAIDREVVVALRKRSDGTVKLWSVNFNDADAFDVSSFEHSEKGWSNYVRGVVRVLLDEGHQLGGFEAAIAGNVPEGSGLSSSAAFEVGLMTALSKLFNLGLSPERAAILSQKAENQFVGVACGIMDQFISALGRKDHALLVDCRSLAYETIPLNLTEQGVSIVVLDTGVRRGLVDSQFNQRRRECEEAVKLLSELLGKDFKALRDVDAAAFGNAASKLPELIRKRASHVISENARVLSGIAFLKAGDLATFGRLMNLSHESLRDDYEVSIEALDVMVELAQSVSGTLGARMMGAGFGGCALALVKTDALEAFKSLVLPEYRRRIGKEPAMWVCQAVDGSSVL